MASLFKKLRTETFKDGTKWLTEFFFYTINVTLDTADEEKYGWKGVLFMIPFIFAFFVILYLLFGPLFKPFF